MKLEEQLDGRVLALGLLEAAPDAILIVRPGGTIALANRMAERTFGYDRAELVGQSIEMLVPETSRAHHASARAHYEGHPRVRAMGDLAALEAQRKNGSRIPIEISLSPVETPVGRLTIAIVRDVTRRREMENQLRHASTHDALTELYNRTYLDEVRPGLESAAGQVAVVFVDVDGLKGVNDRIGHEAGDQLLRRTALVLRSAAGPDVLAVRLGGDEFALFAPGSNQASLDQLVERIRAELARHNELHRGPPLDLSIGAALTDRRGGISQAMRLADHRMYDEKRKRATLRAPR